MPRHTQEAPSEPAAPESLPPYRFLYGDSPVSLIVPSPLFGPVVEEIRARLDVPEPTYDDRLWLPGAYLVMQLAMATQDPRPYVEHEPYAAGRVAQCLPMPLHDILVADGLPGAMPFDEYEQLRAARGEELARIAAFLAANPNQQQGS